MDTPNPIRSSCNDGVEADARYRALFNAIDEGFCIIQFVDGPNGPNSDYVHIEANPAYAAQTGISNVVGRTVREMVPDEADGWVEIYGRVLETGEPIRFERDFVAVDRVIDVFAFRVEPSSLRQVGVLFRDITERRRAEQALRRLNETLEVRVADALAERKLLAEVVESTDTFIQIAGPDFSFLAINRASADEFERIFGVRPKVGDNMLDLIAHMPEHRAAVEAVWSRALSGEEFTEVGEFGDPGRDRRYYEMKYCALRDPDGKLAGAYQFVYDVTERVRDEQRLRTAEEALRQSQKLETMGQLTGGVAHDINNLLTPIVGALDFLQRKLGDDPRAQRMTSGALLAAERATTLVQRLLAFSRRQLLEPQAVDVASLVKNLSDLMGRSLGPQIELATQFGEDLPPARVDRNQLELALLNLAVNARDALGGKGVVLIRAERLDLEGHPRLPDGCYLRISVVDQGAGMDPDTLRRATEPFFTTKRLGEGTGLGLSSVQGLAEQSGGEFELISRPGKGTEASLILPAALDVPEKAASPILPRRSSRDGEGTKVLLVDDDELVRDATAEMLIDGGYEVIKAASAHAALDLIERGLEPDMLVSDLAMPGKTGVELIREVRQRMPGLPALIISGFVAEADEAIRDCNVPTLDKPFTPDVLLGVVAATLRDTPEG